MSGQGRDPSDPARLSVPDPWIEVEEARRQRGGILWSWCLARLHALRRRRATAPTPLLEEYPATPAQES